MTPTRTPAQARRRTESLYSSDGGTVAEQGPADLTPAMLAAMVADLGPVEAAQCLAIYDEKRADWARLMAQRAAETPEERATREHNEQVKAEQVRRIYERSGGACAMPGPPIRLPRALRLVHRSPVARVARARARGPRRHASRLVALARAPDDAPPQPDEPPPSRGLRLHREVRA